jgi:hypothetical protein
MIQGKGTSKWFNRVVIVTSINSIGQVWNQLPDDAKNSHQFWELGRRIQNQIVALPINKAPPYILFTYADVKYNSNGMQWQAEIRNDLRIQLNLTNMEITKYQIANLVEAYEKENIDPGETPNREDLSSKIPSNSASDE